MAKVICVYLKKGDRSGFVCMYVVCVCIRREVVYKICDTTGKHYLRAYYIILNNSVQSLEEVPLRNGAFYGTKLSCDPYATLSNGAPVYRG